METRRLQDEKFRTDIEGMRAVAIILVVFSHLPVPGFSAGFIGVDIFFVISGYLITSLLVREYENFSKINLSRFFANRLRRLMPALLAMLLVSSAIAIAFEPETRQLKQSIAAAAAVAWVSNIYFAFADVSYFSPQSGTNPFLHTWSLGVEEQFYLVWPLLILFSFRFLRKKESFPAQIMIITVVAVLSLLANVILSHFNPILSFYMMPTRAWQFAAGALVWLIFRKKSFSVESTAFLKWLGLLLLMASLVFIGPDAVYPGFWAVLPTLGTCVLLVSEFKPTEKELLKNPCFWLNSAVMQAVGKISYSWYLWHWPVFILGESFLPIHEQGWAKIIALAFSLIAALLAYFLIEKPIRYGRIKNMRPAWQLLIALPILLLLNSQFLRWNVHAQEILESAEVNIYMQAKTDMPVIYRYGCDAWYHNDDLTPCSFGREDAPKTAVLFGDSIGAQWFPALTSMLDENVWKVVVLTKSSCPMVDEPIFYQRIGREYTECEKWRDRAVAWLGKNHADLLLMGSVASANYSQLQWREGTRRLLNRLKEHAGEIYIIESSPSLGFNGPDCLINSRNIEGKSNVCIAPLNGREHKKVADILKSVAEEYENVHWLATSGLVCPNNECKAMQKNMIIFRDDQHLTASFAASAGAYFSRNINSEK